MIALDKVGTDAARLNFFAAPMGDRSYAQALQDLSDKAVQTAFAAEGVTPEEASKMELTNAVWRTTGKYRARLLHGVWATAPFLHNGSVPNLYDLLHRQAQRRPRFRWVSESLIPSKWVTQRT